jgi:hypothetical protein
MCDVLLPAFGDLRPAFAGVRKMIADGGPLVNPDRDRTDSC